MWVVIRLILAGIGFLARMMRRLRPRMSAGEFRGVRRYKSVKRAKGGRILSFSIGLKLPAPVMFRLQPEGRGDRLFKALGLATEFQTDDDEFDKAIYLACDHPALLAVFRDDATLRRRVRELLEIGSFRRLWHDGDVLWAYAKEKREPTDADYAGLADVREALIAAAPRWQDHADRFGWRMAAVEALTWSVFAYAVGGAVEMVVHREDYHVNPSGLIMPGLLTGAALFALLFALLVLLLRGSSRGHVVLIEGALLLLFGFPIGGIQLVSDINRGLDESAPQTVERRVIRTEERLHRGRRGRRYYTYHLWFGGEEHNPPFTLPETMLVTGATFRQARAGGGVKLQLGRGWLGFPWYREIAVVP